MGARFPRALRAGLATVWTAACLTAEVTAAEHLAIWTNAASALETPPRQPHGLVLYKPALNWTYRCTDCHKLLPARWHYDRPLAEHQHVRLEHGDNRFCLNCHHPTNRSAFVDYDGAEISEADVVLLCAKCHGPIYRDWQAGAHGRRHGFWDTRQGPQTRLQCIQCHDPHKPKFQPMKPLAPLRYPARGANPPREQTQSRPETQIRNPKSERKAGPGGSSRGMKMGRGEGSPYFRGKSEGRNPNSGKNKEFYISVPLCLRGENQNSTTQKSGELSFGSLPLFLQNRICLRISDFGILSDFGFRISDFVLYEYAS